MAPDDDAIEELLERGEDALAAGKVAEARSVIERMRALAGGEDSRACYLQAMLCCDEDSDLDAALEWMRRAVELAPDDADLHHALAMLYEEIGDEAGVVRHFVETRILDARADREAGIGSEEDLARIADAAERALAELPEELARRLDGVAVILEPRPSMHIVREGFDPRAFGLFEGPDHLERGHIEGHVAAPTRVVLYTSNLLAGFADDEELAEQVRITVLHEVAHYFGFEEDEMERLGLE